MHLILVPNVISHLNYNARNLRTGVELVDLALDRTLARCTFVVDWGSQGNGTESQLLLIYSR